MDLTESSETSAIVNQTLGKHLFKGLKPLKMDLTEGSETSANVNQPLGKHLFKGLKPLKMDLTESSETSANINPTLGKHTKVNTGNTEHSESLKSRILMKIYARIRCKPALSALELYAKPHNADRQL
jgi:hypothetical protein